MANSLEELVLFGAIAPYLPASFVGRQEPSPLASLRGTKQSRGGIQGLHSKLLGLRSTG